MEKRKWHFTSTSSSPDWRDSPIPGPVAAVMSQRRRSSIDRNGGLDAAVAAARARDVHSAELTDDQGNLLVAASRHFFRSLC
ncbi:hypothetical protein [uncultured Sphingomonas sp.]|uniref:hypothetical protein n=1 Tax=uncultured Sphingomonas sp. TaxID=158754 RepID=UPI0035CAD6AE